MHRDGLDQRASEPVRIRRRSIAWLLWTTALSVFLLAVTAPSLADYPRVSGDDSWVMSASYKLATQGVLGSDLYAGFYGAEQHYFIALPVYHVLQAAVFWMFDAGVAQARAVTLASALVVLGTVSWLAYRWFGAAVAGISGVLLVFWRTDLLAIWPGLPLLSVARTGRYDMTGVAFAWLAIAFLDQSLRRPARSARWPALATGLCAGLATLSQFFGAFTIPLIAVLLPWQHGRHAMLSRTMLWIATGFALVVLPYLGYVVPHWDDFVGQSSLKADRAQFDRPSFYVDNLRDESQRYAHLIEGRSALGGTLGSWLLAFTIWPALVWLVLRYKRRGEVGDRLLLATLVVFAISIVLFDSTNATLYTIILWPALCLVVAATWVSAVHWVFSRLHGRDRAGPGHYAIPALALSIGVVLSTLFVMTVGEGVKAYVDDRRRVAQVSRYLDVAEQLDAVMPREAVIIGHERWWWGLHHHRYVALNAIRERWEIAAKDKASPSFGELVATTGATTIVIDDNARSELSRYPPALRDQINAFLANQASVITVWIDPTYGRFEIYSVGLSVSSSDHVNQ